MSEDIEAASAAAAAPATEPATTKQDEEVEEEEKKDESQNGTEPELKDEKPQQQQEEAPVVDQVPEETTTTAAAVETGDDASDSTPDNDFGDMVLGANLEETQTSTLHVAEQFGSSRPPQYGVNQEEVVEEIQQQVIPAVDMDENNPEVVVDSSNNTVEETPVISLENAKEEPLQELTHQFKPGDHVIRWEMLPIVWPIQVHGIVLEVNQQCVTICDFGLTAEMRKDDDASKIEETIQNDDGTTAPKNKRLAEAWEKVKPKDNKKKERITIHLITTNEQIKPWKKVHYGRGLFGLGGDGDDDMQKGHHHNAPEETPKPKKESKIGNWFRGFGKRKPKPPAEEEKTAPAAAAPSQENNPEESTTETTRRSTSAVSLKDGSDSSDNNNNNDDDIKMTTSSSDPTLSKSGAELEPSQTATTETTTTKKEKNKLPESDPPKLVLARTRLLLEQGEKILPPYHPFKSNSECIAVFCKTGYWRTLQASVFLHSTAIGNAKSTFVATVGVAASMPILAPAMALAGAAMVGAPYVILKQSHNMWNETTIKLNEAFWAQAPNEVFVECIEHWSDLCDTTPIRRTSSTAALSEAAGTVAEEEEETKEEPEAKEEKEEPREEEPAKQEMKETSQRFVSV